MKHLLHWSAWLICCGVAIPIHAAYGLWAYIGALTALSLAMLLQWAEGRFYGRSQWYTPPHGN